MHPRGACFSLTIKLNYFYKKTSYPLGHRDVAISNGRQGDLPAVTKTYGASALFIRCPYIAYLSVHCKLFAYFKLWDDLAEEEGIEHRILIGAADDSDQFVAVQVQCVEVVKAFGQCGFHEQFIALSFFLVLHAAEIQVVPADGKTGFKHLSGQGFHGRKPGVLLFACSDQTADVALESVVVKMQLGIRTGGNRQVQVARGIQAIGHDKIVCAQVAPVGDAHQQGFGPEEFMKYLFQLGHFLLCNIRPGLPGQMLNHYWFRRVFG